VTSKNHAVSVRTRLLDRARRDGEDFQRLLVRYAIERLLYRLSASDHAGDFVLKGATLFALWMGKPHRATKDLDLLGRGSPDVDRLVAVFREIAAVPCPEDGSGLRRRRHHRRAHSRGRKSTPAFASSCPAELAGARSRSRSTSAFGDATVPTPPSLRS
jgi:hypothetical protein